jgi:hypothetical protein
VCVWGGGGGAHAHTISCGNILHDFLRSMSLHKLSQPTDSPLTCALEKGLFVSSIFCIRKDNCGSQSRIQVVKHD